tara:strand:- start:409 stop:1053 length:645 start_codon:yes stop_codon:yes gene_type:complete
VLKDYNISDFIGVYEKALPVELCNKILTEFESNNYNKKSIDDYRKQTVEIQMFEDFNKPLGQISLQLQQILQNYINRYEKKVISLFPKNTKPMQPSLLKSGNTGFNCLQIQKYPKGSKGYSVYHIESSGETLCKRIYTIIFYLNDIEDGGETHFPLANLKIKPKTGTLVIHPCGSPFWHAGLKTQENKYIITGWLQYAVNIELMQTEKITTLEG